jgi:hypothetical protein
LLNRKLNRIHFELWSERPDPAKVIKQEK